VLLCGALSPLSAEERSFDPISRLEGSCWQGTFHTGETDRHCFERTLQEGFIRDRHWVEGGAGLYEGETFFGWNESTGSLGYWYFNSHGGVSVGTVTAAGDDWQFSEVYTGPGQHLEIRSTVQFLEDAYVVSSSLLLEDGSWETRPSTRYDRVAEAPQPPIGALPPPGQ
jgi:hypothetical protein